MAAFPTKKMKMFAHKKREEKQSKEINSTRLSGRMCFGKTKKLQPPKNEQKACFQKQKRTCFYPSFVGLFMYK